METKTRSSTPIGAISFWTQNGDGGLVSCIEISRQLIALGENLSYRSKAVSISYTASESIRDARETVATDPAGGLSISNDSNVFANYVLRFGNSTSGLDVGSYLQSYTEHKSTSGYNPASLFINNSGGTVEIGSRASSAGAVMIVSSIGVTFPGGVALPATSGTPTYGSIWIT